MDEETLVSRCLRGEEDAWRELVAGYSPFVSAVIGRIFGRRGSLRGKAQVEEETASFFGDLCMGRERILGSYRREGPFRAYLAVVAANHARRRAERIALDGRLAARPAEEDSLLGAIASSDSSIEESEEVRRALERCPAADRLLFQLLFVDGLEPERAAAFLGIRRDALYIRKHRFLKRMRAVMDERSAGRARSPSAGESA